MKNRLFSVLKFLIGWPLSILALFFIAKLIAPKAPVLLSHIHEISLPLLSIAVFCFSIYYFFRGYIWKRLIRHAGHEISFKDANFIWAASEIKRYIPGNIWSFLGRAVLFAERGVSKKDIAKYTIIEIELIIIGSIVVALLSIPFVEQYFSLPQYLSAVLLWVVLAGIALYTFHGKFRLKHFILPAFNPFEILFLILLNALMFLFFGLGYYFAIISFIALDPNLIWQITGFSVLAFIAGYLSLLTPSGFGVREGALIFGLTKIMAVTTAGFVALFSRLILIFAELIFVGLSYLWYKTKNKYVLKLEKFVGKYTHLVILALLSGAYTLYFTIASFLRYDNFYAGRFDLGNMAQTVWNTTQGRIFMMTDANGTEVVSRLSVHADFILVLLAPVYALWSDPRNLLLIQTLILAIGSFFVYLIANTVLKNKNISFTFALIYLINPAIQRTNLYDFHAVTLATTFLLGAGFFFIKKRYIYFLIFAFLAGICKEQIWAIIGLFGIFLLFWHKKPIFGIMLFALCSIFSYLLISYAIPNALGSRHFALEYYSEFGSSPLGIIKSIIFSPQQTLSVVLETDRIHYLKQLFQPLGYLSFIAPVVLIFAVPDLIINLLSNNQNLYQIYYQYSATISPFLFIAAIYGTYFLLRSIPQSKLVEIGVIVYLLISSLYSAYLYGPLPGAKEANVTMFKAHPEKIFIKNYISKIDKNLSVAASNNIGSHFSDREKIFVLPLGVEKADVIVFLLADSEYPQSLAAQREIVKSLKLNPNYKLDIERGEFIVFKKIMF